MSTNPVPDTYLMPRLFSSNGYTFSAIPDNPKLDSWSQYLSDYGGRREMNRGASSRWNPTPEQVQALEEMYRRGMITPSTEQIQQIAAKLRRFGRIKGKNVFYWFQNHKARDRQKKRRQLELLGGKEALRINQAKQSSGLSRRNLEMDQHPEKLPKMSKCRTASKEQSGNSAETRCRSLDFSSCMPHNV